MSFNRDIYQEVLKYTSPEVARSLAIGSRQQQQTIQAALYNNLVAWYRERGVELDKSLPSSTLWYLLGAMRYLEELHTGKLEKGAFFSSDWNRAALLSLSATQFNGFVNLIWKGSQELIAKGIYVDYQPLINLFFVREGITPQLKNDFLVWIKDQAYWEDQVIIISYIADPYLFNFSFSGLRTDYPPVLELEWPTEAIEGLNILDLSHADLGEVPSSLKRFHEVIDLDLSSNKLLILPADFNEWFPVLRDLNLAHNQLQSFPSQLLLRPRLESLSISHNPFGDREDPFPGEVNDINALVRLFIDNCGLTRLPSVLNTKVPVKVKDGIIDIVLYRQLTVFDASYNFLTTFRHHDYPVEKSYFNLSHNRIERVEIIRTGRPSVGYHSLNLSYNRLRSFRLERPITMLRLNHNPLVELQAAPTSEIEDISHLDIRSTLLPPSASYSFALVKR